MIRGVVVSDRAVKAAGADLKIFILFVRQLKAFDIDIKKVIRAGPESFH